MSITKYPVPGLFIAFAINLRYYDHREVDIFAFVNVKTKLIPLCYYCFAERSVLNEAEQIRSRHGLY